MDGGMGDCLMDAMQESPLTKGLRLAKYCAEHPLVQWVCRKWPALQQFALTAQPVRWVGE